MYYHRHSRRTCYSLCTRIARVRFIEHATISRFISICHSDFEQRRRPHMHSPVCFSKPRTCGGVQLALTPDPTRGLPVWGNDPRWSLLGHALGSSAATDGAKEEEVEGGVPPACLCYLVWMDDLLEVCGVLRLSPVLTVLFTG